MSEVNASRFGYVVIIGPANAGKSTLLNNLVEDKISIVSNKPHTTRQKILGIKTIAQGGNHLHGQIAFLDTPGFAHTIKRGSLKEVLIQSLKNAVREGDITVLVLDSSKIDDDNSLKLALGENEKFIKNAPHIVVLNKIDLKPREKVLPVIQIVEKYFKDAGCDKEKMPEIIPVSAAKKLNIDRLVEVILNLLPEGEMIFPADKRTDQTDQFFISELIREKVFMKMREEIPYSTAVVVERIKQTKKLMTVNAVVFVEKEGQKGIIIGKGGQALKSVGMEVRLELEEIYGIKVNLQLDVKVEKNWSETEKGVRKVIGELNVKES